MSDDSWKVMRGSFVDDSDEIQRHLEELHRALQAGELESFAMRVYLTDGSYEDIVYSSTDEHSLDELRAMLHQQQMASLH